MLSRGYCAQRLQRELRSLNTKTQLPIHSAAAIFVRHDSERIDKMRVVITGEAEARIEADRMFKLALCL